MGVRLDSERFDTANGSRTALVLAPTSHVRVGRARLEALRRGARGSSLDRQILKLVQGRADGDVLLVFRGLSPDGEGSWRFDDDLSDDEARELGYRLVADQLPIYRRLVRSGVFGLIHVEWGAREKDAFRAGTARLRAELEEVSVPEVAEVAKKGEVAKDGETLARLNADRYILAHLTHFHDEPYESVVRSHILAHLSSFEAQIPRLRELMAEVPRTEPPSAPSAPPA